MLCFDLAELVLIDLQLFELGCWLLEIMDSGPERVNQRVEVVLSIHLQVVIYELHVVLPDVDQGLLKHAEFNGQEKFCLLSGCIFDVSEVITTFLHCSFVSAGWILCHFFLVLSHNFLLVSLELSSMNIPQLRRHLPEAAITSQNSINLHHLVIDKVCNVGDIVVLVNDFDVGLLDLG